MSDKILNIVLCAVVRDDKILLLRREKKPYRGYLALPGGKIEFGEQIVAAAEREASEETGLSFSHVSLRGCATEIISYEGNAEAHFMMFPVLLEAGDGVEVSGHEGELFWVGLDDVAGRSDIIPTDIDVIERYIHNDCREIFHYSVIRKGDEFTLASVALASI